MRIRTAIIPVAGLGTRFLPATKAQPKELLPIVDTPVIQYIVEEAVAAGITQIIFVTAVGKRAIEDHFDRNFELEYRLAERGKRAELAAVTRIGRLASFAFVRQSKPLGDGHAVLAALPFIDRHEPVAVLFGDDLVDTETPAIGQLMAIHATYGSSVIAVAKVPRLETRHYGVIAGPRVRNGVGRSVTRIRAFVEKPIPRRAPSRLAVIGRYILTPAVAALLQNAAPGKDGEIRLADAFTAALRAGEPLHGVEVAGRWFNCGSKLGFLEANVAFGLRHPEFGREFRKYLRSL